MHDKVYDRFRDALIQKLEATAVMGDPMDKTNTLGPLAIEHLTEKLR